MFLKLCSNYGFRTTPYNTASQRERVRHIAAQFFKATPYPRPIAHYLSAILQILLCVPARVLHQFCPDRVHVSLDTLHELSLGDAHCGCQANDGHTSCHSLVLHHPASLLRVFGAAHAKTISAQNNFTCVPFEMQNQLAVVQTLKDMSRALPKIRNFHFRPLAAQVHRIVQHGRLPV